MPTLILKLQPAVPLEASCITPDIILGKTTSEICTLPVYYGNEAAHLGDFFTVKDDYSTEIAIEGDLSRVKHIGAGMTHGRISIHGDVGMHLGREMHGGEIVVQGSAGDWAGAEMVGGSIQITGNVGHGLGGAYRGSRMGMNRGLIVVGGSAGNEVGGAMRRGLIVVQGNTGDFAGAFMTAGTILVFGHLGVRAGAGMKRGTIITLQPPELLPTFQYDCTYQPSFLRLLFLKLRAIGVALSQDCFEGHFRRYSGDLNVLGKGEILIYDQH